MNQKKIGEELQNNTTFRQNTEAQKGFIVDLEKQGTKEEVGWALILVNRSISFFKGPQAMQTTLSQHAFDLLGYLRCLSSSLAA